MLLFSRLFIAFYLHQAEKGKQKASTKKRQNNRLMGRDLNAKYLNGIVIGCNRSIIDDDGNLHTWSCLIFFLLFHHV
jgi:hypothetical protein